MKIRPYLRLVFVAAGALSGLTLIGCHANFKLYPVQGPLFQLTPPPSYPARITGGLTYDHFKVTLADGEKMNCDFHHTSGKEADTAPFKISAAFDEVYGDKFYEGHVLGSPNHYHWCQASGEKGTKLDVAIYEETPREAETSATQRVKGVAQDSKGNVFKFTI